MNTVFVYTESLRRSALVARRELLYGKSDWRKVVRAEAGCSGKSYPITVIPGSDDEPTLYGSKSFYTTISGKRIQYPLAYSRKGGWSNMEYCESTLRIEVGSGWLEDCGLCEVEVVETPDWRSESMVPEDHYTV